MKPTNIRLEDTNYFSSLMLDYINREENTLSLYNRFPTKEAYFEQAEEKLNSYQHRDILVKQLTKQMSELDLSKKQKKNLALLSEKNTVTITTGHQLNLFTGPIFFFYKILQIIKQCKELNKKQDKINFVPIFWMATEDHDFEEINHFKYQDRIIHWEHKSGGPVGRFCTQGLKEVFDSFLSLIPNGKKKDALKVLIDNSYNSSQNLAEATRKLVHLLFKDYGLLLLDGDDPQLKKLMIPIFEKEIIEQKSFELVNKQSELLAKHQYKIQVHPREINLFFIGENYSRERIVFENGFYYVLNTDYKFTQEEILLELNNNPEKFSPNVILRPVYQESILPNVAYIGGGGEIAYWLELKTMFEHYQISFPLLVLRNSLLFRTKKQFNKQLALNLRDEHLFDNSLIISKEKVNEESKLTRQLPQLKADLEKIFKELEQISTQTDLTFSDMVSAQRTKQLKGFGKLEQRLVKAEMKKNQDYQNRVDELLKSMNQNSKLQERTVNFSDFDFLDLTLFIEEIYKSIQPFDFNFIINTLDESI